MQKKRIIRNIVMLVVTGLMLIVPFPSALQAQTTGPRVTITEYALPTKDSWPGGITVGPDGAIWFVETGANQIGRITSDGKITEYAVPTAHAINPYQGFLTVGPDGAIWFNEELVNKLGRITMKGSVKEYQLPPDTGGIRALVSMPHQQLWLTAADTNKIMQMTTKGHVKAAYTIPNPNTAPVGMIAGPDGALWFVERWGSKVGRITTDGTITEYPTPTSNRFLLRLTVGSDGAIWYTDFLGTIGRVTLDGAVMEYSTLNLTPVGISNGPDDAIWFTSAGTNEIGRLAMDGSISTYPVPTANSFPYHMVTGPDGALWFTEMDGSTIGRLTIRP